MTASDPSNGYEAIAAEFMQARSDIGTDIVKAWAAELAPGARVLDLGCGHGDPNMPLLLSAGLKVSAIDASPSLLAAFRAKFPGVETACEPAERSAFFGHRFEGVLAIGLVFLLPETTQSGEWKTLKIPHICGLSSRGEAPSAAVIGMKKEKTRAWLRMRM